MGEVCKLSIFLLSIPSILIFANFVPFIYFNHVHQFLKTFPYFWKQNFITLNFSKKGRPLSKNYEVAIFQRESMPIDPLSSLNTK